MKNKRGEISTLVGVIGISFMVALVIATQQFRNTFIQQKSSAQTTNVCTQYCVNIGADSGYCSTNNVCSSGGTLGNYLCAKTNNCCCVYNPVPTATPKPTTIVSTPTITPTISYTECTNRCASMGYDTGICSAKYVACPVGTTTHSTYTCSTGSSCCCGFFPTEPPPPTNTPTATKTPTPTFTPTATPYIYQACFNQCTGAGYDKGACAAKGATQCPVGSTTHPNGYMCATSVLCCCSNNPSPTPTATNTPIPTNTPVPTATKIPSPTPTPTSVCTDPDGENDTSQNFTTAGTTTVTQWNGTAMQTVPYVDKCVTEGILENFCLNKDIAYYRGPCRPAGTTCVNGACKPPAATATPIPTATKTPTPDLTLTPIATTTIIPGTPCARKKLGDADCKADNLGKWTSLIDFEIWRSEKFAGCRYDNLSACGPDADGDGNPMDANFNYPGSGNLPDEQNAVVDIVDFNIWLLKGFNIENAVK